MLHCSESDKLVQHNYTNRNCVIRNLPSTIPLFNKLNLNTLNGWEMFKFQLGILLYSHI